MARLGSVLGGILAEVAQAQAVSDQLTKDLLEEYEADPVLSALSVPRVSLGDINLTLRFVVDDLEEVRAPQIDPDRLRARLLKVEQNVTALSRVLGSRRLTKSEQSKVIATLRKTAPALAGNPSISALKAAIAGDASKTAITMIKPVLEAWSGIPAEFRKRIGSKESFSSSLRLAYEDRVKTAVQSERSLVFTRAALESQVIVAVRQKDLPDDPGRLQEMQLTLNCGEFDFVIVESEEPENGDK